MKGIIEKKQQMSGTLAGPLVRGFSAYDIAVMEGYVGTKEEWLETLRGKEGAVGPQGPKGDPGEAGPKGNDGYTPVKGVDYFDGQPGDTGEAGNGIASAVLNADYTLTLTFTDGTSYTTPSIRGEQGIQGIQGPKGEKGDTGEQGAQGPKGDLSDDEIALKEDLGNLADNKKKVKVEQTIIHTVKSGATYYALDKMIPANTEVFWSVSTEGSVNNTSLTFNNEQNESKRIWVEPNTSGSLTFDDTLSFFEVWSASTQDGQVTISFYWYCYNQVFASVDAVLELSNRVDSVDVKVEDDEYHINNLQISVFGSKKNMSLIPYLENEDGKYYNAKGEIVSSVNGDWYCNIYKIKDVENISIYNWAGGNLPLCCFFDTNGSFIEGSSFTPSEGWTGLYLSVEKPENAFYIGVNASDTRNKIRVNGYVFEDSYKVREEIERMESIISSTSELSYDVKNLQNQLAKTQRMNDFAYSEFDKAYFVLTIDDANMYLPVVYDLCHELGIPLCPAIIPSKLNTSFDGRTVRDICNLVVADGGEILSHSGKYITNDSTEQDYIDVFRETKKTLENEGFNIRGIITAGGTGYSSFTKKLDDWSRKYYDYSDQNGLKTSIAYSHSRWWHHDYTMAQCKTYVDNAVANKSFVVMAMHGTNDTEDLEYVDHVRELLEYMIAKGSDNLVFTTWAYVYDTFGSTVLEERIKALEK